MVSVSNSADRHAGQSPRGRVALVTGSTGGIGRAVAESLAAAGCDIVLHGLAEPAEAAPELAALAERHGVRARYHRANLARPGEIAAMLSDHGEPDILVNNAATRHFAAVEEMPIEAWETDLAVNLSAAFHLVRLALPAMRRRGWGRIVNMSSIYGLVGATGRVGYVTTKTALLGLTRAVALETARSGITCNAICPGSAMADSGLDRAGAAARFLEGKQPSGRFVEAASIGAMVAFLCGEAGRDITGAALPMDGGWSAG